MPLTAYTTLAKLKSRVDPRELAQLADDNNNEILTQAQADAALLDAETIVVLNQTILDASERIDSELLGRVDMTISANQTAVEQYAADITLYLLYRRRHGADGENNKWYESFRVAKQWLRDVREGRILLATTTVTPGYETAGNTADLTRRFTLDENNPFVSS